MPKLPRTPRLMTFKLAKNKKREKYEPREYDPKDDWTYGYAVDKWSIGKLTDAEMRDAEEWADECRIRRERKEEEKEERERPERERRQKELDRDKARYRELELRRLPTIPLAKKLKLLVSGGFLDKDDASVQNPEKINLLYDLLQHQHAMSRPDTPIEELRENMELINQQRASNPRSIDEFMKMYDARGIRKNKKTNKKTNKNKKLKKTKKLRRSH